MRTTSPACLFITAQQLSSWQHNSSICQQCLEIHDKGCFDLLSLSCSNGYFARFNGFKLIRSSSNIIPIPSKLTPRSFRFTPNPSKSRDTVPKEMFLETKKSNFGWVGLCPKPFVYFFKFFNLSFLATKWFQFKSQPPPRPPYETTVKQS